MPPEPGYRSSAERNRSTRSGRSSTIVGARPLPGVQAVLDYLTATGRTFLFVTNNAIRFSATEREFLSGRTSLQRLEEHNQVREILFDQLLAEASRHDRDRARAQL